MKFSDLGLSPGLLTMLSEKGYETPTPIQEQVIPYLLRGADILACAPTGTGKTGAFCLPLVEILSSTPSKARLIRCLILVPTRELANQVSENFKAYTKNHKLKVAEFIGGASIVQQKQLLARGVDVAVATPGRFLDLHASGAILPTEVKYVVLDEADRMLDMGFMPDLKKILGMLPKMRQTVLFSATMADEIRKLAKEFLMSPKEISVAIPSSAAKNIEQFFVMTPKYASESQKLVGKVEIMLSLLEKHNINSAVVFCNKKYQVDKVSAIINSKNLKSDVIHGDLTQARRNKSLARMKAGEVQFLVASDVAARGIDITNLPCVINIDLPMNTEDYVHRIGRTGRAGAKGLSFSFVAESTMNAARDVMKLIGTKVPFINDWAEKLVKEKDRDKEKKKNFRPSRPHQKKKGKPAKKVPFQKLQKRK